MNTIYISHGDKGGVGKSSLAAGLADYLLKSSNEKLVIVIDGDAGSDPDEANNADVGPRFKDHPRAYSMVVPLNSPKEGVDAIYQAMTTIFTKVEKASSGDPDANIEFDVVINTPANFYQTFNNETQSFFKDLAKNTCMAIKLFYSVDQLQWEGSFAEAFIKTTVLDPEDVILAFPEWKATEKVWMSDKKIASIIKNGHGFVTPKMSAPLFDIHYNNRFTKSLGFFYGEGEKISTLEAIKKTMIDNYNRALYSALDKVLSKDN